MKALGTLLRYRGRIEREHRRAMEALDALRQRRLAPPLTARPSEPDRAPAPRTATGGAQGTAATPISLTTADRPSEPEPALNRHQRRALEARSRRQERRAP